MIVDLFAGMGGWSEGLAALGHEDIGIELDPWACQTRSVAGHRSLCADAATFSPESLGAIEGLIASPPCTDWSQSGKRAGLEGETGALVLEVDRWVRALRPRWVACEQVPPALEWWERFAYEWAALGYSCWAGVLNAANYGVPQTRQRAFLLASLDRPVTPPSATHDRFPMPSLFETLEPWISMADALGWGVGDLPCPTVTAGGGATGGPEPIAHSRRAAAAAARGEWIVNTHGEHEVGGTDFPMCEPAQALTGRARSWWLLHTNRGQDEDGNRQQVSSSAPAPALSTKAGGQWVFDRPATTIAGDPRVADPGYRVNPGENGSRPDAIRLTVADALTLQSFRPDYPVQGTKTKQFEQVGNAIPPLLAKAVLAQVL